MYKQDDITLLFIQKQLSTNKNGRQSESSKLAKKFDHVISIASEEAKGQFGDASVSVTYAPNNGKVAAINDVIKLIETPFVMMLENDEYCSPSKLPDDLKSGTCYRALIDVTGDSDPQRNYQIRIFPTPDFDDKLFDGFSVPDINRSFRQLNWKLAEKIIPIHKSSPVFKISDAERETAMENPQLMSLFWQAILDNKNQKYVCAEEKFRKVLKTQDLFEYNYLAALNGLANALVEQHKLEEARSVASKSLSVNNRQRAPYLTLYKVEKLSGRPDSAYKYLSDYLHTLRFASRANLDVSLSLSECHYLMADTTFKQGDYERAFRHYEWFYELNDGVVNRQILEKLFIYAIELGNYDKSVRYFNAMFGEHIPDNLDDDMSARLLESLSLFMDNGWYDFVSNIYEQLVEKNPESNELLNGWITTLIKNKEVDKAQKLLGAKKAS